jgi:hypothetical protein
MQGFFSTEIEVLPEPIEATKCEVLLVYSQKIRTLSL